MTKSAASNQTSHQDIALSKKMRALKIVMIFELLWPAIWPTLLGFGLFIAVSLLGIWDLAPYWIQSLVLIATIFSSYYFTRKNIAEATWPTRDMVKRRLEKVSEFIHRPLDTLDDKPAAQTTDGTNLLWAIHLERARNQTKNVKTDWPKTGLQKVDPMGLRLLVTLLLILGFLVAGDEWDNRLENAFTLHWRAIPHDARIDIWIEPPEYTDLPPISIASAQSIVNPSITAERIEIPEGSIIQARVQNIDHEPTLQLGGLEGNFSQSAYDMQNYEGSIPALSGAYLTLSVGGGYSASWPVQIITDRPPRVSFAGMPSQTPRATLRITYDWDDDYGIAANKFSMRKPGSNETYNFDMRTPNSPSGLNFLDLTKHPWAGSTIYARLEVRDDMGQIGQSDEMQFILPERGFNHPVARNLVNIRKSLLLNPENIEAVRRRLEIQSNRPHEFDNDFSVYSALRSAYWRLKFPQSEEQLHSATDLLWDTAVALDDNGLSQSHEELRSTIDELMSAMENAENGEQISALTQRLQQILAEMLRNAAQQNSNSATPNPPPNGGNSMSSQTLFQMLQQIQELAAAGQTDQAMQLLEELQNIMENLTNEPMSAQEYNEIMAGTQAMNALDSLQQRQQELLDATNREQLLSQFRQQLGDQSNMYQPLGDAENNLAGELSEIIQMLEEANTQAPSGMQEAREAMRNAAQALSESDGAAAAEAQQEALDGLSDAMSELGERLTQQLSQMRMGNQSNDPLGRPGGLSTGSDISIPDASDIQDAQRILEELRRRLSDRDLTEEEREYFIRLLRRFKSS